MVGWRPDPTTVLTRQRGDETVPFRTALRSLTLAAALLALPMLAVAGLEVEILYDHSADFTRFQTYRWTTGPLNETPEAKLIDERVKRTTDAELANKGLQRVEEGEEADLLISYYGGVDENLLIEGVRFELAPRVVWTGADAQDVTHRYEIGTLVLDFADAGTEKIVWSGVVQARAQTSRQLRGKIEKAVKKVLKKYPPS